MSFPGITAVLEKLLNDEVVRSDHIHDAYLEANDEERLTIEVYTKNRRRELLKEFSETFDLRLYNEIYKMEKFIYLCTKEERYNMCGYFSCQGDYVWENYAPPHYTHPTV